MSNSKVTPAPALINFDFMFFRPFSLFVKSPLLILLLLLTLSGCFGAGTYSKMDYYVYPPDSSASLKLSLTGTTYDLSIGDTIEIENLPPPSNIQASKDLLRTCLYATFGFGGLVVHGGYDSLALTSDGTTQKYSSAYQSVLGGLSNYVVRINHNGTLSSNIPLAYGDAGYLFSLSFDKYSTSSSGGTPSTPKLFSDFAQQLGTAPDRGTIYDRTICFADSSDPLTIHVASLPATDTSGGNPSGSNTGTSGAGTTNATSGDTSGTTPITPPSDEEINKIQTGLEGSGSTLPGGPSHGTTAAANTEQKGSGGGGCPLQLDPGSHTHSTAWVWLAAIGATVWIARRRFKVYSR
jgi:hypothetical protein